MPVNSNPGADLYRTLAVEAPPSSRVDDAPGSPREPRPGTTVTATVESNDEDRAATLLGVVPL